MLLRKPRSYAEVYNDLDVEVVNLFQVLRQPALAARLVELLRLTPFARAEFQAAYQVSADPIERVRRLIVRSFMGFGSDGHNIAVRTGFRAASNRSGTTPAHDWAGYPDCLMLAIDRLAGVVIENKDAMALMAQHDKPEATHYVDPPYLPETRSTKSRRGGDRYHAYTHEMTRDDHVRLLEFLPTLTGRVVLSGYPSQLYDAALKRWRRVEREALADGARKRIEVLWLNPAAVAALNRPTQRTLGEAA